MNQTNPYLNPGDQPAYPPARPAPQPSASMQGQPSPQAQPPQPQQARVQPCIPAQSLQGAPAQPPQALPPQARKPSGWGKLWASLGFGILLLVIYLGVQVASAFHIMGEDADVNAVMAGCELFGGVVGILFVVALGGTGIAKPGMRGMKAAWIAAAWLFFVDGLLVLMDILSIAYGHDTLDLANDWPLRLFVVALLCLGVGLFEETLMRGLCLNGLLARLGASRKGMYAAVIASSVLFGFLHFDFFIDFGDPLQVAQNLMKVVQTGIVGYLLAAIVVYTRNLWAPILIHAANDFLLMFMSYGLRSETLTTEYVQTGDDGIATLVVYVVLSLLYIPLVVFGTRMLNRVGSWRGDFYHYDDPPKRGVASSVGVPIAYSGIAHDFPPAAAIPAAPYVAPGPSTPVASATPRAVPAHRAAPAPSPLATQPIPTPAARPATPAAPPAAYPPTSSAAAQAAPVETRSGTPMVSSAMSRPASPAVSPAASPTPAQAGHATPIPPAPSGAYHPAYPPQAYAPRGAQPQPQEGTPHGQDLRP